MPEAIEVGALNSHKRTMTASENPCPWMADPPADARATMAGAWMQGFLNFCEDWTCTERAASVSWDGFAGHAIPKALAHPKVFLAQCVT